MKRLLTLAAVLAIGATNCLAQDDALTREDKEFLKNASEIGITEVELGKLAEQKGGPEVKKLGAMLVADHSKSNQELATLAKSKKVELKMEPAATQKQMLSAFEGKSGAEFDKEFKEHVTKDHEKAIKTFQDAAKDAKDPDVKAFATKNLKGLQAHHSAAGGQEKKRD